MLSKEDLNVRKTAVKPTLKGSPITWGIVEEVINSHLKALEEIGRLKKKLNISKMKRRN